MAELHNSPVELAATNPVFIDAKSGNNVVADFVSDAWGRAGFRKHMVQAIGEGTVEVFGTVIPSKYLALPFDEDEWVKLADVTGGQIAKIDGAYTALRVVRDATTTPLVVRLLSYDLEPR